MNGPSLKRQERMFNDPKPFTVTSYFETRWVVRTISILLLVALPDMILNPDIWNIAGDVFIMVGGGILVSPLVGWVFEGRHKK